MKIGAHLLIADLHIGITRELYEKGVSLPSQVADLAARLNALRKLTKTATLVVAGDFKHKVPGVSLQELREIPQFLSRLEFRRVIVVKGNHDANIEKMLPSEFGHKVSVKKSLRIGNCLITHGHRNVSTSARTLIIGHNHPHVLFIYDVGARYVEPCWVRGTLPGRKKLVIMPAFNPFSGAIIANKEKFIGPIARRVRQPKAYLLDGTDVGRLRDMMIR